MRQPHLWLLAASLALPLAACGDDGGGGGEGGSSGTSDTNATSTGTASKGASTSGSTTSPSGSTATGTGGCCKVKDDVPESCANVSCGGCVETACSQQVNACGSLPACLDELEGTFLPCMCDAQVASDMTAEDACIATFDGFSAEAAALLDCVLASCAAECTL